jgi:metal-dependent amidase/aminoacylase/carboxypeptidase family protein
MATLICIQVGEENFGINAGEGKLCLTLRAETTSDLLLLKDTIIEEANKSMKECYSLEQNRHIRFEYETCDEFDATENSPEDAALVYEGLKKKGISVSYLDNPMRWSEDFGNYSKRCHSFFFGLGSGKNHPGLHMEDYSFPERLLEIGPKIWQEIVSFF